MSATSKVVYSMTIVESALKSSVLRKQFKISDGIIKINTDLKIFDFVVRQELFRNERIQGLLSTKISNRNAN